MGNINKIRLSGQTYNIEDSNATKTISLTQAEYDAIVSGGTLDPNALYIITDAQGADLSNYYTKSETSGATQISTALGNKQDTLVSGTNIKTINNESILGSGNINIQGGGKAIEAGRGISITTGETADTVSLNEAISASTASSSTYIAIGSGANAEAGYNSFLSNSGGIAIGSGATANRRDICIGNGAKSFSNHSALICIGLSSVSKQGGISIGNYSEAYGENGYDQYGGISIGLNSKTQSRNAIAIGYNTVASGTTKTNINNQLTIDTSNQVYIYNKDNTEMICLQDQLGGGEVSSAITSGDTNAVAGGAVYDKFDEVEQVTAAALNTLNDALGGMKIVKLTESEYTALTTKDSDTLYVVIPNPSN